MKLHLTLSCPALLLLSACSLPPPGKITSAPAPSAATTSLVRVGEAEMVLPQWLLAREVNPNEVSKVWRRTFAGPGYRFEISYGRSGSVSQSDGGVVSWKKIAAAAGNGFEATYRYNSADADEGFAFGRRTVVFRDDFTRHPNARRLLVEGYCRDEATCAAVTTIATSARFH